MHPLERTSENCKTLSTTVCAQASCSSNAPQTSTLGRQSAADEVVHNRSIDSVTRDNLPSDGSLIFDRRVLIVGHVTSPQEHIDLVNALWKVDGVKEVVDHLELVVQGNKDGCPLCKALLRIQIDAKFVAVDQWSTGQVYFHDTRQ